MKTITTLGVLVLSLGIAVSVATGSERPVDTRALQSACPALASSAAAGCPAMTGMFADKPQLRCPGQAEGRQKAQKPGCPMSGGKKVLPQAKECPGMKGKEAAQPAGSIDYKKVA